MEADKGSAFCLCPLGLTAWRQVITFNFVSELEFVAVKEPEASWERRSIQIIPLKKSTDLLCASKTAPAEEIWAKNVIKTQTFSNQTFCMGKQSGAFNKWKGRHDTSNNYNNFFYEQIKGGETRNSDNMEEIMSTELALLLHYWASTSVFRKWPTHHIEPIQMNRA